MLGLRTVCAFTLVALCSVSSAQIYKWTDENGRTHYGDMPPQSAQAEDMGIPQGSRAAKSSSSDATSRFESQQQYLKQQSQLREEKAQQEQELAAQKKADDSKKEYCNNLRLHKEDVVAGGRRMYRSNAEGERVYMNDDEIVQAQKDIVKRYQEECGS